jgi:hypothetical protein
MSALRRAVRPLVPRWVQEKRQERKLADREAQCPLPGGRSARRRDGTKNEYFTPLDDPVWVAADEASHIADDDTVLGFEAEGRRWAVSWDVMAGSHVANLTLEGRPYVIGFCDACVGAGLWSADVGGKRLRFQFEGVWEGTPYAMDDDTGGLWRLVTMEPLHGGAFEHGPLPRLPLVYATWAEWRAQHPDTLVVDDPGEPEFGHGWSHRWPGHDTVPKMATRRTTPDDPRLHPVALVLATEIGEDVRAYPIALLHRRGGVVNDVLGGVPIAAIAMPGSYVAIALRREVDGQTLTLEWTAGDEVLTDVETGTTWDLFGHAVDGPLAGTTLAHVWGGLQKWFNWSNLNVGGEVWGVDAHLGGPPPPDWDSGAEEVGDQRTAVHLAGRRAGKVHDHDH